MGNRMTVNASSPSGIRRVGTTTNDERSALEGMLKGYPIEQLVDEVLAVSEDTTVGERVSLLLESLVG